VPKKKEINLHHSDDTNVILNDLRNSSPTKLDSNKNKVIHIPQPKKNPFYKEKNEVHSTVPQPKKKLFIKNKMK
jgi:hypothetical protein